MSDGDQHISGVIMPICVVAVFTVLIVAIALLAVKYRRKIVVMYKGTDKNVDTKE